jgi:hypothetical protein
VNAFAPIDPKLIDVVLPPSGYSAKMEAEDTTDAVRDACGSAARDFPDSWWIEPSDWADAARDNDKYKTWGINYLDRFTNQDPTHECTCHSLRANFEAARNQQRGVIYPSGPQKGVRYEESGKVGSVWVSPLSVYAEANPGQWGGANVRQVMEIACKRGMLPEKIQPHDYGFKHTLQGTTGKGGVNQSSGSWVRLSQFPDGWQETAAGFKPEEVVFPEMWEQAICLLLKGKVVSVGRNGHAVPWASLAFEGDTIKAAPYPDSYDLIRYDSLATIKRAWQGAFSIITVTAPDDWSNPARAA